MTISFEGTSKKNLQILNLDPMKHNPLMDMDDLVRQRWVPYQTTLQAEGSYEDEIPDYQCVLGSPLGTSTTTTTRALETNETITPGGGDYYDTSTEAEVEELVTLPTFSGLIGTVLTAYNLHQNLILRPDDIWITILGQFSAYVNGPGRAEELRSKFVNHTGQMELTVTAEGSVCEAPYGTMTRQFLDEISKNLVDPSFKEWFLPGFTTSTETDDIVASAAAMCTFQPYFTYTYSLVCGIPQITLLGSVEDWSILRQKVERLVDLDASDKLLSEQWVPLLRQVLDQFVESAKYGSQYNVDFWDRIVQFYVHDLMCAQETHLTGWLSVFTFFNGQGQMAVSMPERDDDEEGVDADLAPWPRIAFEQINHNVVSCPVRINDNGKWYNASLYVGQMAYDYGPDMNMTKFSDFPSAVQNEVNELATLHFLQPRNDWAMAVEKPAVEEEAQDLEWFYNKTDSIKYETDSVVRVLENGQCQAVNLLDDDLSVTKSGGDSSMRSSGDMTRVGSVVPSLLLLWLFATRWF